MLSLAWPTPADWAARNAAHVDRLLVEQAHLEKKAAAGAVRYLFEYPDHTVLHAPLSALAREELEHFELVVAALERRGVAYARQEPAPYAARLLAVVRRREPERLLDRMLCNAAIEARSCERMMLLSRELRGRDPELAELWAGLVGSEARHHELYVRLAQRVFGEETVAARIGEVMEHEGEVVRCGPRTPGLHNA
jgi:tRNA-(ms[2]io[6]A)-hydroxylase